MKRIYSFMFAAVAIFAAASCQKEMANVDTGVKGDSFTFTATIGNDTKTALSEGTKVVWTPGDLVTVFDATGKGVRFSTPITSNAAEATFSADVFNTEGLSDTKLVAIYPDRTDIPVENGQQAGDNDAKYTATTGKIASIRIAGKQTAVENSFDCTQAPAVGVAAIAQNPVFTFNNVHTLFKFKVGGESMPESIVLKNNEEAMIAGLATVTVSEEEGDYSFAVKVDDGANQVTLKPADGENFVSGKTYYIVTYPFSTSSGISVLMGGEVVKTNNKAYNFEANKIYDLGELTAPVKVETPFDLERVAAYYSNGSAAWCSFIGEISNRTMAADNKYVYLNSSVATPTIYAVEIASLLAGDETPTYKTLSTANMSGGTHGVSALRCIANESGDPILIATNLAVDGSQNFNIYAYLNGTDADPVLFHAYRWDGVANVSDWRRYGDRISVSGTWQNGKIWAPSQSGTKVMGFGIKNGATSSDLREYCWFDTFVGGLAEVTLYPGTTEALLTTASSAGYWAPNTNGEKHSGGNWPKWDAGKTESALYGAFSFQFFTFEEKDYIAYVQLSDNTHANLVVVEDKGSLAESLASPKLFELPLYEGDAASCEAGNTYGDCAVVTVNGKLHIVAMMQGGGLSIFEIKAK